MAPSKSFRNHNPGNIRFSPWSKAVGGIDDGTGFARFQTDIDGLVALARLLSTKGYRLLTIQECINRYAPASDNNKPKRYAEYIADKAGVTVSTRIIDLNPFQFLKLMFGITEFEGWKE